MSNVKRSERIEIDRRKMEAKKKRKTAIVFELNRLNTEIQMLEERIAFNEQLEKEKNSEPPAEQTVPLFTNNQE